MEFLLVFLGSFVAMMVLDGIWLGFVAKSFYATQIGHLLASSPNWYAAAAFYPLFCLGLVYFAVYPNIEAGLFRVVIQSALLGALCYATYDLSNMATLKDWPLSITLVDMAWGAVISAATGSVGYLVAQYLR